MEFNDVFQHIGDIGLYQILMYCIIGIISIINGLNNIGINFMAGHQEHWCSVPRLELFPHDVQKLVSIPPDSDDPDAYDTCSYYDLDYGNLTDEEIWNWDRNYTQNASTLNCDAWVFDQSVFISTINSKYNLVCDRSWMSQFVSTAYMFGMMIGSLLSGFISDRFGRYWPLIVGLAGYFIFGFSVAFAPNYTVFVILRFMVSLCNFTAYLSGFVILMEFLGPKYRTLLGVWCQSFFSLGIMLVSGFGYAIRDLDKFLIAISCPLLATIPFIWIMPESPRWLISKGRYKEAEMILRKVADVNGRSFPEHITWSNQDRDKVESGVDSKAVSVTLSDICRSSILRPELALMYLNWFTTSLVYYGLAFNTGAFGDVYLNTFLSGLIEVPAYLICMFCMDRGSKRLSNAGSLLVAGIFCFACVPVLVMRDDLNGLLTALSTIGKGAISFSFGCIYVYTSDLFPTPVRHKAVGTSSVFARIGSMASPYMGPPMEEIWLALPSVIFGSLAIFTGSLVFMLPETRGHKLPDTIEESEYIGSFKKSKSKKSQEFDTILPELHVINSETKSHLQNEVNMNPGKEQQNENKGFQISSDDAEMKIYANDIIRTSTRL